MHGLEEDMKNLKLPDLGKAKAKAQFITSKWEQRTPSEATCSRCRGEDMKDLHCVISIFLY